MQHRNGTAGVLFNKKSFSYSELPLSTFCKTALEKILDMDYIIPRNPFSQLKNKDLIL